MPTRLESRRGSRIAPKRRRIETSRRLTAFATNSKPKASFWRMGRAELHGGGNERQRMTAPLYTTEILRLAASLYGPRELERVDGGAEPRSPTCGSRVSISVQLDGNRRVEAISQQV